MAESAGKQGSKMQASQKSFCGLQNRFGVGLASHCCLKI